MEFRTRKQKRGKSEVNLTPLVDIVFILLIFFLITSTFVQNPGIEVELPKASAATADVQSNNIILAITRNGQVIHEGQTMSSEELKSRLEEHYTNTPKQLIVIQADSTAHHGKVVEVMDMAQAAGFHRLAIATEEQ